MACIQSLFVFAVVWFSNTAPGESRASSQRWSCPEKSALDYRPPEVIATDAVGDGRFDSVLIVTDCTENLKGDLAFLKDAVNSYVEVDSAAASVPVLIVTDVVPSGRLIWSPTGPLYRDYDDVRRFADAATAGLARAVQAGSKKPLLIRPQGGPFNMSTMVTTLAALEYLYMPLELREAGENAKVEYLGVWYEELEKGMKELNQALNVETGRTVARDIAGTDPERMAPPSIEAYVREVFRDSGVEMAVISDVDTLTREYPLLAAVNRAANSVARHRARLIYLEYTGSGEINETLFLVGKGITFDTGGASIKTGTRMVGMSRDKSGAAAVAGFMKVISLEKPTHLRVVAAMPLVRNSVGEESYTVDEVITSRAGVRVRVSNTDAEGRMVMADVLCRMKEMALNAVNPHLMAIATLTGHAVSTAGTSYSIILDNGPAKEKKAAERVQAAGELYGDPFDISTIRREDYDNHRGRSMYEHINQMGDNHVRGHQGPAAFLIMASGLDKHGKNSSQPLAYSHLDIAGSARVAPKQVPSGVPVVALSGLYLLDQN
ncbi:hypothetical protein EGW08_016861 [Elysia chlorotica]|uniref:Cytosol aminopeptidase domain-containing protein n=1 Tax=Elysia chlorotica TaxID=188477 RepID=A0A3S1AYC6_ELYCH|nr:hypothetical protein EGW08_016861 [Elysia chlorotica]